MQAYKCDRCGGLYEKRSAEALNKISKIFDNGIYGIAFAFAYNYYDLDLCPNCLAEFEAWYENGAAVKEQMK